jgi:glycosyltransferase involved in cell wall biosynthesis
MRVLVNALSARLGGGQTYLLNLLGHAPQEDGWRIFVLVQPSFPPAELPRNVELLKQASVENPLARAVWEEFQLAPLVRRLDADLFFSPGGLLPRALPPDVPAAVTFQNMLPFDHVQRRKYPYGYRRARDWLLERGLSWAMRRADLVIFISEFARDFIGRRLGSLQGQHVVIPHGVDASFRFRPGGAPARPAWLPEGDYVLYVSYVDHYKAQLEVVRGFDLYRRQGGSAKLILAGPEYRPYGERVRREIVARGLQQQVIVAGNVPHAELPAIYQHARINLFASFTENCPNILLEMMASGRPALVSNRPPMTEFAGEAAAYFDPADPADLARQLAALMADEQRQRQLAGAALERIESHTWGKAASLTWRALGATRRKTARQHALP